MLHLARMACLLSIVLTSLMTLAAQVEGATVESQMKVQGKIVSIGTDLIVIDTPTASYTLNQKTAPLRAKIGDTITLWVTSDHVVIDHHPQATGQRHRFITGTLLGAGIEKTDQTLDTRRQSSLFASGARSQNESPSARDDGDGGDQ